LPLARSRPRSSPSSAPSRLTRRSSRALLIFFRWKPETVFSVFAERGPEELLSLAGVSSRSDAAAEPPVASTEGHVFCGTCLEHVPSSLASAMPSCGHTFCTECWRTYLRGRIRDGAAKRLLCAHFGCGAVCDERAVLQLISADPTDIDESEAAAASEAAERYRRSLTESFVDDNASVRWCPSLPHCGAAVQLLSEAPGRCEEPSCSCGETFCFACAGPPHSPATCAMAAAWRRKGEDESESANWLQGAALF